MASEHAPAGDGVWDGLAVAISEDRMVVGPEGAALFAAVLSAAARVDGVRFSPAAAHVRRVALQVASQAGRGHADVRCSAELPESGVWITTAEVSERLGLSQRQCSRLAVDGTFGEARKVRGRWTVQLDEVAAYATDRRSA